MLRSKKNLLRWSCGLIIGSLLLLAAKAGTRGMSSFVMAPAGFVRGFSFFPYTNEIDVELDGTALAGRGVADALVFTVTEKGRAEPVARKTFPIPAGSDRLITWRPPALGEGEYVFSARSNGVGAAEVRIPFVRHVFAWEHNTLGKSGRLPPPFTPIEVEDGVVSTILRRHAVDSLGLWRQVTSEGQDLLAGPMRLELRRGGKTEIVQGADLQFTKDAQGSVITTARFDGGTTRAEWDCDGMMRWTLELAPSPEPVESLVLVVPLRDRLMPLMHACTDGIRINYAGAVAAGSGVVWKSAEAKHRSMLGSYVPYVWIGGEERGLAVFGANDRGWVNAAGVSCQELRRDGGTLMLCLNLIARPITLTEARRITIGFQATPTKPMPAGWRLWTIGENAPPPEKSMAFLGSCWTWGARTPCADLYPRDEDYGLWDKFREARATGKFDRPYLTEWADRISDPKAKARTLREVGYAFHTLQTRPPRVLVYTNPRGVRFDTPEGQTFLDDWLRFRFARREWSAASYVAYEANLAESFRDYALWHYRRMLESFVDGIYWDDTFLQSTYALNDSDCYSEASGRLQPDSGLWSMRDLIRRTAVMDTELGRAPMNMLHTTNAAIAPILSFGQMLLTWEDKSGNADFQDRHTRDYLRAESIGWQHGVVPFGMFLITAKDPAKRRWIERTGIGVALVHEIKVNDGDRQWHEAYSRLLNFGYGGPDVHVYDYWAHDNPVTVTGTDAVTVCLSKPGSTLIVVCDYGGGGDLRLALNRSTLGLSGELGARDVESGKALQVTSDGAVEFNLRKHDYCIIAVDWRKAPAGRNHDSSRGHHA